MRNKKVKILLFGKDGQLGIAFRKLLDDRLLYSFGRMDVNFRNLNSVIKTVREISPQIIVNTAAYTNVDKAETEEKLTNIINGVAPGVLAEEAKKIGAVFIHFSTDYVFDGLNPNPYTEEDRTNPINQYGKSKLLGENNIRQIGGKNLIFRTSWVYSNIGNNFITKVIKLSKETQGLKVVTDQIGSPTSSEQMAKSIVRLIDENKLPSQDKFYSGLFHLGGRGSVNRYDFAKRIMELANFNTTDIIRRMKKSVTSDFKTLVKRPLSTALNCNKFENTFGFQLPYWEIELAKVMKELL